jgi:hypothetical protein
MEIQQELVNNGGVSNTTDAFNHFLKLPAAGKRNYDGELSAVGTRGYLWSSSAGEDDYESQYLLYTNSVTTWYDNGIRAEGKSIRCIRNDSPLSIENNISNETTEDNTTDEPIDSNTTPINPDELVLDAYQFVIVYINIDEDSAVQNAMVYNSNPDVQVSYVTAGTNCTDFGFNNADTTGTTGNGITTTSYHEHERFCWDTDYTNSDLGSGTLNLVIAWNR